MYIYTYTHTPNRKTASARWAARSSSPRTAPPHSAPPTRRAPWRVASSSATRRCRPGRRRMFHGKTWEVPWKTRGKQVKTGGFSGENG